MSVEIYTDTLNAILKLIPVEFNMINQCKFDNEIENKNYKPYVYYDRQRGILKAFRVNKKNLDTLFTAYDCSKLPSSLVNKFDACLYLDKERDGKAIKMLPPAIQKQIKNSMFNCIQFKSFDEFMDVFGAIKDKIQW
jgi:hypothetical protein